MLQVPKLLERLCMVGNHFDDSFIVVDCNSNKRECIYVNQKFLEETGYSYQEVIGRNLSFLQGSQTSKETKNYLR